MHIRNDKGVYPARGYPILILMYHAVISQPLRVFDWCFIHEAAFEAQLNYVAERFEIVPLARVPLLLSEGVHRPTMAITFDDGFSNNYEIAFPLLRQANVPATIFICTDLIDTDNTLWFCRLNRALAETHRNSLEWDGIFFHLDGANARALASARLQAQLKRGTPVELLDNIEVIIRSLGEDPQQPL